MIRLRTNYRNDPPEQVYLCRLQGSKENARRLFLKYMNKINDLKGAEFYNALLDNCTTAIWLRTRINQQHLPFSWKILLSAYFPEYLYDTQRLDARMPFSALQRTGQVNSLAQAADQPPDLSTRIRAVIE